MDKSKLASIGERLKSGSAQMGRMMSSKMREMKDMLQAPTPESKVVDQATLAALESPDWGLNLRICAMINAEELSGTEVLKAVKRKISVGNDDVHSQRLGLELLEACAMNCEKVFSEIAAEKVLEEMVKVIEYPQSERECSVRAMEMIRAWGESEDLIYLPVFRQTYENLKQKGMPSHIQDGNLPMDSYLDQDSLTPSANYPLPDTNASGNGLPYTYGGFSIEEKKEFLEITRNSLEVLSSLMNSASKLEPELPKDDLTMSMLDKCKESQPLLQRIIETTSEDETLLFEALNLHDELEQIVSKFDKLQVSEPSIAQLPEDPQPSETVLHPQVKTQDCNEQPRDSESPKVESKVISHTPNLLEGESSGNRE
ncbi:hypothetical protein V2J09_004931 [Rumex salicifolius]